MGQLQIVNVGKISTRGVTLRYLLITFIFILCTCFLFAESNTDEAHEKLANGKTTGNHQQNDSDHDNDEHNNENTDDDDTTFAEFIMEGTLKIFTSVLFNYDLFFFEGAGQLQTVSYNNSPFSDPAAIGFRNDLSSKKNLMNIHTAYGFGISTESNHLIVSADYDFYGFALKPSYKFISEAASDDDINHISIKLERKSIAFPRTDFGISCGIDNINIANDNYTGFSLAHNMEIFLFNPISLRHQSAFTFYKNVIITDFTSELRLHHNNYYFNVMYNDYKIDDVELDSILFGLGISF